MCVCVCVYVCDAASLQARLAAIQVLCRAVDQIDPFLKVNSPAKTVNLSGFRSIILLTLQEK